MLPIRQLQFIRSITISQSSAVSKPNPSSTLCRTENIRDADHLTTHRSLEIAEFKALGNPPSILSINSPPSVPIYIRRGSLLSIYGSDNSPTTINSSLEVIHPLKRFVYGGYVSTYQKIISTVPFSILVSSISRSFSLFKQSGNKSFATLFLDGSSDWAILNTDSLQVYTGNALNVSMHKLPKLISKQLATSLKISNKTLTGVSKWNHTGYTLLSGRGQVGLVGNGQIYNINLSENEEVLINKDNLIGISVNGPYDLQNCILKYSFITSQQEELNQTTTTSLENANGNETNTSKKYKYWDLIRQYSEKLVSLAKRIKTKTYNSLVGGQEFVKITGPRNLLLQSNTKNTYSIDLDALPASNIQQSRTIDEEIPKTTPSDYLNYVTIQRGKGAVFESTPDFKETVEHIKKK